MSITLTITADTAQEFIDKFGIVCTHFLVAKQSNAQQDAPVDPTATATETAAKSEKPKRTPRKTKAEKEAEKAAEPVVENEKDDGTDAENDNDIKIDDVKSELLSLMEMDQIKGPDRALRIFREMDARNISDVSPDRWPELMEKLAAAKAELAKAA